MSEQYEMLGKTEIHIQSIHLDDVNLDQVAAVVSEVLGLPTSDVFVIDARDDLLTLDVMDTQIDAKSLLGKEKELLARLDDVEGLTVTSDTAISSHGILGWIVMEESVAGPLLDRSENMSALIHKNINRRVLVFPTGPELISGQIEDTNSPYISKLLSECGLKVNIEKPLPDDGETIARALRESIYERGYRYVFTTGGVGAEGKDCSVESLLKLDPDAATPYIAKFEVGTGRHVKDGIRIGVGLCGSSMIFCLPGPHAEVTAVMPTIVEGIQSGLDKIELANAIASILRGRWLEHHHVHSV